MSETENTPRNGVADHDRPLPGSDRDQEIEQARALFREQASMGEKAQRIRGERELWTRQYVAISQVLVGLTGGDDKQMAKIPGIAHAAADGAVRRYRDSLDRDFKAKEPEKQAAPAST